MFPEHLKYTSEHEWVDPTAGTDGSARIGITAYAQEQLGDIVFAQLPEVGEELTAGAVCGELESTKSVSEIYAPVGGVVVARNEEVLASPELVNSDPYAGGWMFDLRPADADTLEALMDAAAYQAEVGG